jgi:hypothetical protein
MTEAKKIAAAAKSNPETIFFLKMTGIHRDPNERDSQ